LSIINSKLSISRLERLGGGNVKGYN